MGINRNGNNQRGSDRWRPRLAELDVRWRLPAIEAGSPDQNAADLTERIKELNCLYAVSQLMERDGCTFEEILAMIVDVLPPSWLLPEIACARIVLDEKTFESLYFRESPWQLSAPILLAGETVGEVSVFYTEPSPPRDEGPFLKEERFLINALAERLGRVSSRNVTESRLKKINRQIEIERTALREANAALRAVMDRGEIEKREMQRNIVENVRKILVPIVHELAISASPGQQDYLALLEENLEQIASPFVRRLGLTFQTLSTTEIRICDMIRNGLGSKEIADLRGVSVATVSRHREHIRRKLGIANTKVNLETYLQTAL